VSELLLVATRSRGKQAEFRALLRPLPQVIVFPEDLELVESEQEANLEAFDTLEANARAKAGWFAALSGLDTLADDSGLEVDALGGAPGAHSKRFAGVSGPDERVTPYNNAELLRRLEGVPTARRTARYRCVLVLRRPAGAVGPLDLVTTGSTEGRILEAPEGRGGFGYDPLFWSTELGKSFGVATAEEKGRVSHRGRAAEALIAALTR
jgi:XTP/dITP diphosphohydrolase